MRRGVKRGMLTAAIAGVAMWCAGTARLAAQAPANSAKNDVPRTADGHPDLSGVWWRGADVGGRAAPGTPAAAGGRGGGRGAAPQTFAGLYNAEAKAKAKTLADKDDPTLACQPTAFGTLNVRMFDVGAVAQIVQTPKFVVLLTETFHGFQIIPTDGRPHRDDQPPSFRGDSIGHWEGNTLVVDTNNFTDNTWLSAEGRVSFHSDALHVIERYTRTNANTMEIEATVEDPKVLTEPWKVPKQTLVLAPFDQILNLDCYTAASEDQTEATANNEAKK